MKPCCFALVLAIVPLVLWHLPIVQRVILHISALCHEPGAPIWFLVFAIPYCAVGLSRQVLCLIAGAGFGVVEGLCWCSLAYEVGALLSYGFGRFLSEDNKMVHLDNRRGVKAFLQSAPFRAVLGLRLMPFGSSLLVSVFSGAIYLPWKAFACATALGGLPQNVVFVMAGSGINVGHEYEAFLAVMLFTTSILLGIYLLRRYRANEREILLSRDRSAM
ncbi:hypothetical protein GS501_07990 [Saccharibacter sp. 17.LH.SD]|uniref:TVP38/TMEM64 family protein n=1 Tax=Saccharibacter sp. 17.LH.SD TaxID=2689393 RepID=UPI001369CFF5|nr:hypothetical protein [Saccharibacter sp. 17.LH.SD]